MRKLILFILTILTSNTFLVSFAFGEHIPTAGPGMIPSPYKKEIIGKINEDTVFLA